MQVRWYLKYVGGRGCQVGDVVNTHLPTWATSISHNFLQSFLILIVADYLVWDLVNTSIASPPDMSARSLNLKKVSSFILGLQLNATSVKNE